MGYGTWCMMQGPVFKDCETECARLKSVVRVSLLSPAVLRTLLRPASTRQLRLMVLALGDRPVDASWLATELSKSTTSTSHAQSRALAYARCGMHASRFQQGRLAVSTKPPPPAAAIITKLHTPATRLAARYASR